MSSAVNEWLQPQGNFIGGNWVSRSDSASLEVRDKYNQELLATLSMATEQDMEQAIVSAIEGFHVLRAWQPEERSAVLAKVADLLEANTEAFVQLIVKEAGKPVGYAEAELNRCLTTMRLGVQEALQHTTEILDDDFGDGKVGTVRRFPIGPIACISPFNFPLNLALHKIVPAIAAGCSVILKPSPYAPLSVFAFARLAEQAGFPAGALNVLMCDNLVAEKMVRDDRLKMLSFTGSPQVGWMLKELSGKKKVTLELGGNAAVVIDDSANLETAAKTVARGAFLYAGQICISTQRIYVHEACFDQFVDLLLKEIHNLGSGDPNDPNVSNGPLIDKVHLQRIKSWVEEAIDQGAQVLAGGQVLDEAANIYAPTLLSGTSKDMKVVSEEVFGPVAVIESISSFQEGLDLVNDSRFGLQAGVFTDAEANALAAFEQLEVGGVMINNVPGFRVDSMPYGGIKDSGLGREGIRYAMEDMTEMRLMVF